MHLLDFEHFDLVRELLKNRLTIVWCTRLQRAQADDERQRIEASPQPFIPACTSSLRSQKASASTGAMRRLDLPGMGVAHECLSLTPELP